MSFFNEFCFRQKKKMTMMHSTMDQFNEVTLNQYRRKVSSNSHRGLFVCPNNCSKNHYYLLLRNPILPEC